MAELQPNDEFLVNRDDVTYKQPTDTLMAKLENDDYLLINREDVTYKISGEDILDSLIDPLELDVTLDITNPAPDETITAIASPSGGKQPYTPITYQWKKRDQGGNITDLAGETLSTFFVTADLAAFELACEATVSDSLGKSVTTLSAFTNPVTFKEQVDTPELLTPPDGAGMGLGVNPESGFILSAETEGPTATMNGLRFDKNRETYLLSTLSVTNPWTVSVWVKLTRLNPAIVIGADGGNVVYFDGTNWRIAETTIPGSSAELNTWQHIVATGNATHVNLWLDGVKVTTGDGVSTPLALVKKGWWIGANHTDNVLTNSIILNGYLSDVYNVEQEFDEPAEVFGKFFNGVWGPLDSSEVLEKISSKETPYDTRPNYDEKWSDGSSFSTNNTNSNLFDGDTNSYALCSDSGFRILTPKTFTTAGKIELFTNIAVNETITVRLNGSDTYVSTPMPNGPNTYITVDVPAGTYTGLEVKCVTVASSYSISSVRIDGRVLIDGPADNSQVWSNPSNFTTDTSFATPVTNLFDGNESTGLYASGQGSSITWDASSFGLSGTVRVRPSGGQGSNLYTVEVNDTPVGVSADLWSDLITVDSLEKIKVTGLPDTADGQIRQIEVAGKILIDAPPAWDTSQVWSDDVGLTQDGAPAKQMFDGDLTTSTKSLDIPGGDDQKLFWRPSGGLAYTERVEVYTAFGSDGQSRNFYLELNETSPVVAGSGGWHTLATGSGTITSISSWWDQDYRGEMWAIRVDGKILVDPGNFGTNGFYLPFDPAAEGDTSPKILSCVGCAGSSHPADGSLLSYSDNGALFSNGLDVTFDAGSVRTFTVLAGSGVPTISLSDDGTTWTAEGDSSSFWDGRKMVEVTTRYVFMRSGGANWGIFRYNNIGADASGQGNNFADRNFVVGDRIYSRDGWSTNTTFRRAPYNAFDGSVDGTTCLSDTEGLGAFIQWNLPEPITDVSSLTVIFPSGGTAGTWTVTGTGLTESSAGMSGTGTELDIPISGDLTDLRIEVTNKINVPAPQFKAHLGGIKINGILLVDGNFADTVLDTPVTDYAVLEGHSTDVLINGNLVQKRGISGDWDLAVGTIGKSNNKIYAELTIKGGTSHQIGIVNLNDAVFEANAPLVDYTWGYGFINSGNQIKLRNAHNAGTGENTDKLFGASGSNFEVGDVIGLAVDLTASPRFYIYKNGTLIGDTTNEWVTPIPAGTWTFGASTNDTGSNIVYNYGQQDFIYTPPAGYEGLYQPAVVKATLQIADAGTLDLIEGNPTMTASVGGAKGTYASHTDSELVLDKVSGTWEVASEKAVSDVEYSIAAINPNDFVMTSSAFEATPSDVTHGASTWQVTEVDDYFYLNPAINVTSTTALESLNTGGLEEETVYRARVKHTSANGVDSLWSEQRHQNVFKTEKIPVTVPTADMNGLRFDGDRETHLRRSGLASSSFTYSCWVKKTTGNDFIVFAADSGVDNQSNYSLLEYRSNLKIYVTDSATSAANLIGTTTYPENIWHHIVYSYDGTDITVYVNGVQELTGAYAATEFKKSGVRSIGNVGSIAGSGNEIYADGYLSDAYFVDGQALGPEAFGALFPADPSEPNRRWGPLDSTVVIDNINNYEPTPDAGPNYSQKWSDYWDGNVTNPEKSFDGNTSSGPTFAYDVFSVWTPDEALTYTDKVELYLAVRADGGEYQVDDGSGLVTGTLPGSFDAGWVEVLSGGGTFKAFSVKDTNGTSGCLCYGVKVDGRSLIDGPADQSQMWSGNVTNTGSYVSGSTPDKMFNGDLAQGQNNKCESAAPGIITFTSPVEQTGTLRVYLSSGANPASPNGEFDFKLDGVSVYDGSKFPNSDYAWVDFGEQTWTTLSFGSATSPNSNWIGVTAIEVDGKILIDGAPAWNTSQVWSEVTVASATGGVDNSIANVFDGNTTTNIKTTNNAEFLEITFNPPITFTSKVEHLGYPGYTEYPCEFTVDNVVQNNDSGIDINSGPINGITSGAQKYSSYTGSGSLSKIKVCQVFNGKAYSTQIRIDGEILVNAGSFGANGFYLPFDPAATGANYSSNTTAPDLNRGTFANLFDGDLSTAAGRDQGSTSPTPQEGWTLTFDNSITNVKKVEIKPYKLERNY